MPKIHITKNYIRQRKFNPKQCKAGTFRVKQVSPKTKIVLCKLKKTNKQKVQSILHKKK